MENLSGDKAARRVAMGIVAAFGLLIVLTNINWCAWPAANAVKDGNAGTCWEFWLNRYQTLVGAVLALLAGTAAFWATLSQFRLSRQDQLRKELALAVEHQRKVFRLKGRLSSLLDTTDLYNMLIYPDQRALIETAIKERDVVLDDVETLSQEVIFESYQPYYKVVYPQGLKSFVSEVIFAKSISLGLRQSAQGCCGWMER